MSSHAATAPWFEQVPEWCAEKFVVPSLQRAIGLPLFASRVELRGEVVGLRPCAVSLFVPKSPPRMPPDLSAFFESASSSVAGLSARVLLFADFSDFSGFGSVAAPPP